MKNLVFQCYIKDNVERGTKYTYHPYPRLERKSREQFKRYAKIHGADYEFYEPTEGKAHWVRMAMFDRPDYDNVLYVDCDVVINPSRWLDNIFDQEGTAVPVPIECWDEFNMGVVKWTREECEIMSQHIDDYYDPKKNQKALNRCYKDHIGEFKELPYRYNVTHRWTPDCTFRHYPGYLKDTYKQCPIWKKIK